MTEELDELLELIETVVFTNYHKKGKKYQEYRIGEDIKEINKQLQIFKQIREVVTRHSVAPSTQMMRYKKIQRLIYG